MAANKKDKQGSQQEDTWLQKLNEKGLKKKEERKRQNRRAKEKNKRALDEKRKEGEVKENEKKEKGFLRGISKNENTKQTR